MPILKKIMFFCFILCCCLALHQAALADTSNKAQQNSSIQENNKVWRIAYIEGGPFSGFQKFLKATVHALQQINIIDNGNVPIPEDTESAEVMWKWLTEHAGGNKIEFLKDGFYSGNWDDKQRNAAKAAILQRIRNVGDIDMIFAFGVWAGIDMATDDHSIPVFSIAANDPLGSGIIKSPKDSGRDHVHALIEENVYKRQITFFHDVFHFKKLGIIYEDTQYGRNACSLNEIEETAKLLGIELVRYTTTLDLPDQNMIFNNLSQGVKKLSTLCDAFYMTATTLSKEKIPSLIAPLLEKNIPTFSQDGEKEVEYGILMSLAEANLKSFGQKEADAIAQVMSGTKPRYVKPMFTSLDSSSITYDPLMYKKTYTSPISIVLNLKNSMLIGWNPPLEILVLADKVYQYLTPKK